jgi:hypothetical protein
MYILLRNDTMKDGFVIPLRKKKKICHSKYWQKLNSLLNPITQQREANKPPKNENPLLLFEIQ